jgi:hypothetical protein
MIYKIKKQIYLVNIKMEEYLYLLKLIIDNICYMSTSKIIQASVKGAILLQMKLDCVFAQLLQNSRPRAD